MTETEPTTNQTEFAQGEPELEAVSVPLTPEEMVAHQLSQAAQRKQRLILSFLLCGVLVIASGIMLAMRSRPQPSLSSGETTSATPSPSITASTQLQQELQQLDEVVSQADPSSNELQFPPVDLTLSLFYDVKMY